MSKNKCTKMIECSKARSAQAHESVMNTLTEMMRKGQKISVNQLSKLSGVSSPTIYKYDDVMEIINKNRDKPFKKIKQSEDSKDAIIKTKNQQISSLSKALAEAEKDAGYKQKYFDALEEIALLKKRIQDMLSEDW